MFLIQLFLFEVADPELAARLSVHHADVEPATFCATLRLLEEQGAVSVVALPGLTLQEGLGPVSYEASTSTPVGRNEVGTVFLEGGVEVLANRTDDGALDLDVRQLTFAHDDGKRAGSWSPYPNLAVLGSIAEVGSLLELQHEDHDMRDRCQGLIAQPRAKDRRAQLDALLPGWDD